MGTTLTGTTPQDTYDSLIKVTDNGPISGTLKALSDGLGNDSTLSLSTTAASIAGTLAVSGNATFDTSTLVVDATNNRVGVGTATPTAGYSLSVVGAFGAAVGGAYVEVGEFDRSLMILNHSNPSVNANLFEVQKSGTGVFTLTSAGNVGIGTSTAAAKLAVNKGSQSDTITIANSSSYLYGVDVGLAVGQAATVTFGTWMQSLSTGNAAFPLLINPLGGNVGVATTTPAVPLDVVGNIRSSTGILFGTDTAAANLLDDYEEGTFTPTIIGTTTAGTATYGGGQQGLYTKIGRMVYFSIYLGYSGGTGTGDLRIAGLPFTIASAEIPSFSIGTFLNVALTASNVPLTSGVNNSTQVKFDQLPTGGGTQTAVPYDDAAVIAISGFYQV